MKTLARPPVAGLCAAAPLIHVLAPGPAMIVLVARAISGAFLEAFLILPDLARARPRSEDAGGAPLILLDEVTAHLDSDSRAVLFAAARKQGAQTWMPGSGDEQFAMHCDAARRLGASGTGRATVVTCVLAGS